MAGLYNPPNRNEAFVFRVALQDMAVPGSFKSSPTIAAGDFKVDKDGAGFNNLGTIPAVDPTGTVAVKITLSATEMDADVVTITWIDQTATKEWADGFVCILTS